MSKIIFHVQDANGKAIAGALLSAVCIEHGNWQGSTDSEGNFVAYLDAGHYDITTSANGYLSNFLPADLANPGNVTIPLASGNDSQPVNGITFPNGWQYKGSTDFRLFKDILDGKDVSAVINQRKSAGANILRILSMAGNLFQLDPDNYSDSDLSKAIKYINSFDLKVELVALADCAQPLTKSLDWQRKHVARLGPILGNYNLEELGNEINNFYQNVNPLDFEKPQGCLSSRGSVTGYGNWNLLPASPNAWDYSTFHGDRDEKWLLNIAKAGLDLVHGFDSYKGTQNPLVHNEPNKPPHAGDPVVNPRTTKEDWFIAGVQCGVWRNDGIGGGCFHCDSGLQSLLWDDNELACAREFYRGMNSVL